MLLSAPLTFILAVYAATGVSKASSFRLEGQFPEAFQAPSPNSVSPYVVSMAKASGSRSHSCLNAISSGNQTDGVYTTTLEPWAGRMSYFASITFGNQTFQARVDTGSSNTLLVGTRFQCVNATLGEVVPSSACKFGPTYDISSTFNMIHNESVEIVYGDGTEVTGFYGYETVTMGGITVSNQQVGVASVAIWNGDGISSGEIGLAFPSLAYGFTGYNVTLDTPANRVPYTPIFTSMYTQGLVNPLFSLALRRGNGTSQMAIGGLLPGFDNASFTSTPIQYLNLLGVNESTPQYQFYTIEVAYVCNGNLYNASQGATNASQVSTLPLTKLNNDSYSFAIVDSGTTLLLAPPAIAKAILAQFQPLPVFSADLKVYVVDCNATAPQVGIVTSDKLFEINQTDLIRHDEELGICYCGVGDSQQPSGVLGDVFLTNVLAVYDVGASEMRFAPRSNSC